MKRKTPAAIPTESSNKQQQYSKRVLSRMIQLWFAGAVFGMLVVTVQLCAVLYTAPDILSISISLDGLLNYIGIPMTGGIVGYLIKSAVENREKIHNTPVFPNDIP